MSIDPKFSPEPESAFWPLVVLFVALALCAAALVLVTLGLR